MLGAPGVALRRHHVFHTWRASLTTFASQATLPKLPVAPLQEVCDSYQALVEPLLTPAEFERTSSCIAQLAATGHETHQALFRRAGEPRSSWLEEWWDDLYLKDRGIIAVNVNYVFKFIDDQECLRDKVPQTARASRLLYAALKFRKALQAEQLKPDMERTRALCMSQYPRLFSTARVPHADRDELICYQKKPLGRNPLSKTTTYRDANPRHVAVIDRGHIYTFDVLTPGGTPFPPVYIENALRQILAQKIEPLTTSICSLTGGDRLNWAHARSALIEHDNANETSLEKVQSAIFTLCLDPSAPKTCTEASAALLHGDGSSRWFDKHQLVVFANGVAGLNLEHSTGDGSTALRLADFMLTESFRSPTHESDFVPTVEKLTWNVPPRVGEAIDRASRRFQQLATATETQTLMWRQFGAQAIKQWKISPDAFVQAALQLAGYRLFGRVVPTYESASTKTFLHGRTETLRSATSDAAAFVKAMTAPTATPATKVQLLRTSCDTHARLMKMAKAGRGVDRCLLGMRMLANEGQFALFSDPGYQKSLHYNLSTSHCGSSNLDVFAFGPVVDDGLGIGYFILDEGINFNITGRPPAASAAKFVKLLSDALAEMGQLVH